MTKIGSQEKQKKELIAITILIFAILLFFMQHAPKPFFYDFYGSAFLAALFLLFLLGYRLQKRTESYKRKYLEIKILTNNINGGIVPYALDNKLSILHANDGYHNLIGYSRQEVREQFNNSSLSFMGANELLQQIDLLHRSNTNRVGAE